MGGVKEQTMKKYVLVVAAVILACGLNIGIASATFEEIYTVDNNGSTTLQNVYSMSQTPWLYLALPNQGFHFDVAIWTDPNNVLAAQTFGPSTSSQVWFSPFNWNSIKQPGVWTIAASYLYPFPTPSSGNGVTSLTVTPEPVSSGLFLLGGAALAAAGIRKKLKAKK